MISLLNRWYGSTPTPTLNEDTLTENFTNASPLVYPFATLTVGCTWNNYTYTMWCLGGYSDRNNVYTFNTTHFKEKATQGFSEKSCSVSINEMIYQTPITSFVGMPDLYYYNTTSETSGTLVRVPGTNIKSLNLCTDGLNMLYVREGNNTLQHSYEPWPNKKWNIFDFFN